MNKEEIFEGMTSEQFKVIGELVNDPNTDGTKIFTAILEMPEQEFEVLRPALQEMIVATYDDPTFKLNLVQNLTASGLTVNDILNNADEFTKALVQIDTADLSQSKKDFIQFVFTSIVNSLSDTTLNPARYIEIPVEVCRENVKLPTYATNGAGAMDIYSPEEYVIEPGECKIIPIGIKVAIPAGYGLLIQPRSGLSRRIKLRIPNTPGLIDEDYHEEIGVIVENIDPPMKDYKVDFDGESMLQGPLYGSPITIGKGERFAQMRLVEIPRVRWREVQSLGSFENDHGTGFGGTGTK